MDWLRKHWKGSAGTLAILVLTPIADVIVKNYLDVSILGKIGSHLGSVLVLFSTPLSVPAWLAGIVLFSLLIVLLLQCKQWLDSRSPRYTETQIRILQAAYDLHKGRAPTFADLTHASGTTDLAFRVEIKKLQQAGLVETSDSIQAAGLGLVYVDHASLTDSGRAALHHHQSTGH